MNNNDLPLAGWHGQLWVSKITAELNLYNSIRAIPMRIS